MSTSTGGGAPAIRYRPIFGGVFGRTGRYVMGTMSCIERGLHAVRYVIVEPRTGAVLAVANDKQEALASARRLLKIAQTLAKQEAANEPQFHQANLWSDEQLPPVGEAGAKLKPVPKRRKEVFDKSEGKCFYCGTVLSLTGAWHVEHQMPRALMGPDELLNLVAACVPCNLSKGPRSAIEFVTQVNKEHHHG